MPEYASLILRGWIFKTAILSDFNCNGKQDVLVASYFSQEGTDGSIGFFKINLQLFEGGTGSWKLITQKDALGEPFEIRPLKMSDGTNAAEMTLNSAPRRGIIYLKNNYLYGM